MPLAFSTVAAEGDKTVEQSSAAAKAFRLMRASQLIGKNVENSQGENLGEIKDLVIDVNNERVFYAILEFGGFLGLGEKLFAYPVRSFNQTSADTDKLVLNVDKDKLKAAPGFARDSWPDWLAYGKQVDKYHGETVKLKSVPNQKLVRASSLRELVFTKVPLIMSSSCTNGVVAHEDNHTGTQRRVYTDGGFDWAAG